MRHLIYYIPGTSAPARPTLRRLGITHACDFVSDLRPAAAFAQVNGPDGGRGTAFARTASAGEDFWPRGDGSQRWHECAGGAFWVGWRADAPPGPDDLARDTLVPGHPVELADGARWTVPIVRRVPDGGTMLPEARTLDADGKWTRRPLDAWAHLRRFADRVFIKTMIELGAAPEWALDQFGIEGGGETDWRRMSDEEALEAAVEALAVNYRIGRWEAAALGLFHDHHLDVCRAMIDWPAIEGIARSIEGEGADGDAKKKPPPDTPDSSPTASGATGSAPPDTCPPTPSSTSTRSSSNG